MADTNMPALETWFPQMEPAAGKPSEAERAEKEQTEAGQPVPEQSEKGQIEAGQPVPEQSEREQIEAGQSEPEQSETEQSEPELREMELPGAVPANAKTLELEQTFSYDGYQVVRRELFAHLREPAVTIRYDSTTFNTACIDGLEDVVYVQVLVNPDDRKMVVRKCGEDDKDALRWCIAKPDKRKSRKITSRKFSEMVYSLMGWSLNCRYKILGYRITFHGEMIYVFDLTETEIFAERPKKGKPKTAAEKIESGSSADNAVPDTGKESSGGDTGKESNGPDTGQTAQPSADTRKPFYPEEWRDSFGLPVEEHRKALEINVIDGYAVFGSKTKYNRKEKED